jgi:putative transposase
MSTFTAIAYHIVFSTRDRAPVLCRDRRSDLCRYIWGIIRKRESHLYRINGVQDHLHIVTSLHPTVSLANFVKDIKTGSARWIKQNTVFKGFSHWQEGYGAFTCSRHDLGGLIEYIKRNITARQRSKRNTENCWQKPESNLMNATCSDALDDPSRVVPSLLLRFP